VIATAYAALTVLKQRANLLLRLQRRSLAPRLLAAHSIRFQQLSLLISIFATMISRSANELFDTCCRHQPENAGTYDSRRFWETPKGMNFRPAMETQARNENAKQAQRTNSDNPKKL
jgi:hypothetical protein